MGRALLLLLRLTTALNPLQKLLVEGELRRRPDWVDGGAAQVAPRVWRWVAEADDAVLALPELSAADARRLAASLEAAGAAVEASATRRVPTLTKRRALPPAVDADAPAADAYDAGAAKRNSVTTNVVTTRTTTSATPSGR